MPHHGQPITLSIDTLTGKGDGIANWHDRKVFIPGTLPGEQVEVSLHGIKPKYAQADLIRIIQPHPQGAFPFTCW